MKSDKERAAEVEEQGDAVFRQIEVEELSGDPFNPRTEPPDDDYENLARSVKDVGVLQPIPVRQNPDWRADDPAWNTEHGVPRYRLLGGHKRLRAALEAKRTKVPVLDHGSMSEAEALLQAAVDNLWQQPLTSRELWALVERVRKLKDPPSDEQIAAALGIELEKMKRMVRPFKLAGDKAIEAVKNAVEQRQISPQIGAKLAQLPAKAQSTLLKQVKGKNAEQAAEIIRHGREAAGVSTSGRKVEFAWATDVKARAKELSARLDKEPAKASKTISQLKLALSYFQGQISIEELYPWTRS